MTERYTHTNKDKKYAAVCLLWIVYYFTRLSKGYI
jgi:hypothetical protein